MMTGTRKWLAVALVVGVAGGCNSSGSNGGGTPPAAATATVTQTVAATVTPTPTATPEETAIPPLAFVVVTDFQTGSFATVSLDEPRVVTPASPERAIHSDAVARVAGGLVYVVNRIFADNIQILDPRRGFATVVQCSTGNGSNPHDIVIAGETKAYVTLYDTGEILVVNPSPAADCSDFEHGRIDLAPFADADGNPEADQMAIAGGELYVLLQRLDRNNFFTPAGHGGLLVIDTGRDEVVREIELSGANPFAETKGLVIEDGAVIVAETGEFGVNDGGIERVDPVSGQAQGFFITEEELGGDVTDFVLTPGGPGYAVVSAPDFTNSLVAFDPATGTLGPTLLSGVPFLSDIEFDGRGELFVADRTLAAPGIRIFRAGDGVELTAAAINLGLPPFEIVFLD